MLAYKKYALSAALAAHLNTFTAMSQREALRHKHTLGEEGAVARKMAATEMGSSVEPPPLPARLTDLPPPSQLPRMVTNDEGEVFWYIPRKRQQRPKGPTEPPKLGAAA